MCWKVTPEISSVLTFKRRRRFQAKKDDHDELDGDHDDLQYQLWWLIKGCICMIFVILVKMIVIIIHGDLLTSVKDD